MSRGIAIRENEAKFMEVQDLLTSAAIASSEDNFSFVEFEDDSGIGTDGAPRVR